MIKALAIKAHPDGHSGTQFRTEDKMSPNPPCPNGLPILPRALVFSGRWGLVLYFQKGGALCTPTFGLGEC